ncbi:hypothetical protein [Alphaproteobacteria bacterium endosymbiont of Tiliacea citrago]|uniref:hypothetical protein n=1 Tax=Alphaproteobacteria bacterium endosymbiont of Tiliacea citrago TaxID=3077944 RepID=UPI00313EE462
MKKIIIAILSLNYLCAPKPSTTKKNNSQIIKNCLKKGKGKMFLKIEIDNLKKQLEQDKIDKKSQNHIEIVEKVIYNLEQHLK